jgi:Uma2 family endonuclease
MTTATAIPPKVWTEEELLAMPDDGVERWIINGQLREQPSEFPEANVTVRNRHHSKIMSLVATALIVWTRTQPVPRGEVYCGEIGVRLPGATTTVGVDVVYVPGNVVASQDDDKTTLLDGVPTLAVEILSPNDVLENIEEKVDTYLAAGVPLVWVMSTHYRTVTIHRPGREPELFNVTHHIPAEPQMPGFTPAVIELFE